MAAAYRHGASSIALSRAGVAPLLAVGPRCAGRRRLRGRLGFSGSGCFGLARGIRGFGLFLFTVSVGGLGLGVAFSVIGHVPAATFELQRWSGEQPFDLATT